MFEPEVEKMSYEEIRKLQSERLVECVKYCYEKIPLYKRKMDENGVKPEDIKGVEDLSKLPFTTKDDLRAHYPYGILAVPREEVIRFHASSGTTGKPTVVGFTKNDIALMGTLNARSLACAGVKKEDIVQNAYTYGLFTGGLMFHYGIETLGATVIPSATGNTQKQIQLIEDMKTSVICCTPSYSLRIAEVAREGGSDLSDFNLRIGVFGAEPWSEGMRKIIEDTLKIQAMDMYGLSELGGPGVAIECQEKNGLHVWSDHYIAEIIDGETGEPLPPGEKGELVFTILTKEAMPLLRYRTRDISSINVEPCACGRGHPRIARISGRNDDMLIIGGINVFPSAIEEVITSTEGLAGEYQLIITRDTLDKLTIQAEVRPDVPRDKWPEVAKALADRLVSVLSIRAKIELAEFESLPRSMGKAQRVQDLREGKV